MVAAVAAGLAMRVVLSMRVPCRILFTRVPYYLGPKTGPLHRELPMFRFDFITAISGPQGISPPFILNRKS